MKYRKICAKKANTTIKKKCMKKSLLQIYTGILVACSINGPHKTSQYRLTQHGAWLWYKEEIPNIWNTSITKGNDRKKGSELYIRLIFQVPWKLIIKKVHLIDSKKTNKGRTTKWIGSNCWHFPQENLEFQLKHKWQFNFGIEILSFKVIFNFKYSRVVIFSK